MVYVAYKGMLFGGWLIFLLVLFIILAIAGIIWFILYVEMSQRKNWKMVTLFIVLNSMIVAFAIQLMLLQANVIF
ncbi:MAG: hypothetical protein GOP50_05300 [Candidatus Heimdallarchaeota archaeon]|nr:hypothetical protein [Candidatus Heimdallarchaeota archaeon]